jgi:hypothetical protein
MLGPTETELLRVELYRGLVRGDRTVVSLSEVLSRGRYEIEDCRRGLVRNPSVTFELDGGVLFGECSVVEDKEGVAGVEPNLVFEGVLASTR